MHRVIAALLLLTAPPLPAVAGAAGAEADCRDPTVAAALERANANLALEFVATDTGTRLDAVNLRPVIAELLVSARAPGAAEDRAVTVPPLARAEVMAFAGLDPAAARSEARSAWRFQSYMGAPGAVEPDTAYRYRLPFRAGKSYRLVQGFGGTLSHQSGAARHALDFQLEVGEPVHAARAGTVVRAVDWFCRAGGPELLDQGNMVIIAHDDGTMAHYVHLAPGGVLVREGDRVERGQRIAAVGMTGYTGGPHLHFVVMRERDQSIPIRFEGYDKADLSRPAKFRVH